MSGLVGSSKRVYDARRDDRGSFVQVGLGGPCRAFVAAGKKAEKKEKTEKEKERRRRRRRMGAVVCCISDP